ncbi:MAG TPA: hypothetical protein VHX14_06885 [Thermoanaerobaculia bacterium]|jgi:hypothetical protein|nr:hypothetical protein [Thermoanaerobaculia bacterium]
MIEARSSLRRLTRSLLDEHSPSAALEKAASELFLMFCAITGDLETGGRSLPSGLALSPALAANCTNDARRTAVFLRGLHAAIRAARRRFPGQRLEVVYAGTGPFAPLAVPLMSFLSPNDLQFTLIDIHEHSMANLRSLVDHLGFTGFVRDFLVMDATDYQHPHGTPLHIVLTETMQRALSCEPQVAILRRLAPQLTRGGFFLPQEVRVDLSIGGSLLVAGLAVPAGRVMTLTTRTAAVRSDSNGRFPAHTIRMPSVLPAGMPTLRTEVRVFGRHVLREFESGLTTPDVLWDLNGLAGNEDVSFWYQLGERPGIRWRRLDRTAQQELEAGCNVPEMRPESKACASHHRTP